jgi:hypothetical protein
VEVHHHAGKTSMSNAYLDKLHRKAAVTCQVIEDHRLSVLARLVFVELLYAFHNTQDGDCHPAAATIGKRIGRHERKVRGAITELEAAGKLETKLRQAGVRYTFPGLQDLYEQFSPRPISALTPAEVVPSPPADFGRQTK